MVILGLGSNLGDRLAHLRAALRAIQATPTILVKQVSPVYISDALLPDQAPPDWDHPYLNLALRCETTLDPLDLLKTLKQIEWSIGRNPEMRHWGPRVIDIDVLALEDQIIQSDALTVPHFNLLERPFALWPLADVAPDWRFPLPGTHQHKTAAELVKPWGSRQGGEAPFHTCQIQQRIDMPQLVGIINITPDSFSDGGQFDTVDRAIQQALHLVKAGAEIIDIGAESTAPQANPLDPEREWQRLRPLLSAIQAIRSQFLLPPKISVDTHHPSVAAQALAFGIDWINDVTGLEDEAMRQIAAEAKVDCVMMHHLGLPAGRELIPPSEDPVEVVYHWAIKRLELLMKSGISPEKIIVDPGIGFGKTQSQSLRLIKECASFQSLGIRSLVGHSRKSFLSWFTALPSAERDLETATIALYLAKQSVNYLRVHNVDFCARAFKIAAALS